jgi:valyl-tRNA synthetase
MPFITEELWHELNERKENECMIVATWPQAKGFQKNLLDQAVLSFSVVGEIRNIRNTKGISPKESLALKIKAAETFIQKPWVAVIQKLSNVGSLEFTTQSVEQATAFLVGTTECFIPMAGKADPAREREAIGKELDYLRGFLVSVEKKLSNEKFVSSAPPQVIETERKKKADAEAKITSLAESLKNLG